MGSEQRNALIAVVLSGLILFGWQYYFAPPTHKADIVPIGPETKVASGTVTPVNPSVAPTQTNGPIEPATVETFTNTRENYQVSFSSTLAIEDFKNTEAALPFIEIVGSKAPMKVEFDFGDGFKTLSFVRQENNKYYNAQYDATVVTNIDEKGVASFDVMSSRDFKFRFIFTAEHLALENKQQRKFALYTDKLNLFAVGDDENGDRAIKWAGIDFNYHLFAAYFEKEATLLYKTDPKSMTLTSGKAEKSLGYRVVYVKKEYNYLTSLGHNLKNSVDFGIWGFFAVWILKGLQFFHNFTPNYGVCIILLTLLIRMITFPLQYKSFVSMKKLQLVQPELTKIREKFKEDPQRLQKESMELFKRSGANPLGGCLPLVLQMPVFFAFYKVLYSAVELVDAPFVLWIHDLSNKDPFYVLPVLMTVAMFLQQRLTPNTISDPTQKKVMMFMPLIFGFIMKDLPSGLSLYIFVSTLFGIVQQLLVFKKATA
jgi:YidC/Oxa1 family membrane protein insertase